MSDNRRLSLKPKMMVITKIINPVQKRSVNKNLVFFEEENAVCYSTVIFIPNTPIFRFSFKYKWSSVCVPRPLNIKQQTMNCIASRMELCEQRRLNRDCKF